MRISQGGHMTWQEYQEAVCELYEVMDGIGTVHRDIHRPDLDTGRPRQIDLWLEIETKGLRLGVLVDAKFHDDPIDVNTVEQVVMLAKAVGASKGVIVAPNGYTEGALAKAAACDIDCRIWTLAEALELMEPEFWILCPNCERDCMILDQSGLVEMGLGWLWWLGGACRSCKAARIWCQACGVKFIMEPGKRQTCGCDFLMWEVDDDGIIHVRQRDPDEDLSEPDDPNQLPLWPT